MALVQLALKATIHLVFVSALHWFKSEMGRLEKSVMCHPKPLCEGWH